MIRVTGGNRQMIPLYSCFLLLFTLRGLGLLQAQEAHVVIDAYPNTTTVEQGTTLVLVCRVVGVPSTTVLSYQWTCPGGSCDAGAVDPEWAAKVQQGNILVVNVCNGSDAGSYTCIVRNSTPKELGRANYSVAVTYGLSLMNENGGLSVFFPNNSFVTNTTLTHTNSPRGERQGAPRGNDHVVCYGESRHTTKVIWHNSGGKLEECPQPCRDCGDRCARNGGVGEDPPLLRHTHIHMYTNSTAYVNQDLECRTFGVASSSIFIGVYLKDGVNTALQPPSSITPGATTTTTVSVSWSPVMGATGYYVSYQRQDLGTPPVVTPQYERIVGGATSVTLSGLEPGTIYRIRVWSTDGASVSSEAREMNVATVENASLPTVSRRTKTTAPPEQTTLPTVSKGTATTTTPVPTTLPTVSKGTATTTTPVPRTEGRPSFSSSVPSDPTSGPSTTSVKSPALPTSSVPPVPTSDGVSTFAIIGSLIFLILIAIAVVAAVIIGLLCRKKNDQQSKKNAPAIFLYGMNQVTMEQQQHLQDSVDESKHTVPIIESVYAHTVFPETEQHQSQANSGAPIKCALQKSDGQLHIPFPRMKFPKPPEAAAEVVYAAVEKESKNCQNTDEDNATPDHESSERARMMLPPSKMLSSNACQSVRTGHCNAFDAFLNHVETMHSQGKASFEAEFYSIDTRTNSSTVVAELNSMQNRYRNIFPYDSSRVVLSMPNSIGTDYINASFVDGYMRKDRYIASQAPVPGTVDDFWQMIWDNRIDIVVMLTKTMEGRKRKSEEYFSESPGDTFSSGRFEIKTSSLKYHVDYDVRVLEVAQESDPSETRTLDHYLFTGWPDLTVPKYPTSLIHMLHHVREARVSDIPILVHCSAGVGRTGTFIVLDVILDQMNAGETVDIKGTVQKMREKRMFMVQTLEQYIFVHDAVRELLLLGDTTIKAGKMRRVIAQLSRMGDDRNSGYQQQFAALSTLTQECADDERVEDLDAIRYPDRAPIVGKHLFVSRPETGPVLINASFVDGYHAHRAFIAAQSPMETTVGDVWKLIADKKVQTVLLLCQTSEDACQYFLPGESGVLNIDNMRVVVLKKKVNNDIDTYTISIQKARKKQDITLLHYKQWPEKRRPRSASFLKLFSSAQKLQQPHSDKPILVACNDGLGRTGTFIAIWSLIEQLKAEGQIDVVGTIKSIRTQRPGAVPDLDQFVYCHDLLLEYVDSFEGYSNFNE